LGFGNLWPKGGFKKNRRPEKGSSGRFGDHFALMPLRKAPKIHSAS
jgi:hypothetical protein